MVVVAAPLKNRNKKNSDLFIDRDSHLIHNQC